MTGSLRAQLRYYTLALLLAWSLVCLGAFFVIYADYREEARRYAMEAARESLQKDLVFRLWNAGHGGVYVLVSDQTPPNPQLAALPQRDITTSDGHKLTLVDSAYMTRQVHELEQGKYGSRGHITSLKPLRAENAPDAWETQALLRFTQGEKEFNEVVEIKGMPYLRAMIPLVTETHCLKCHATQGFRVGDLRGGLSVSVPLQNYLASAAADSRQHGRLLFGPWGCGVAIILFGGRLMAQRMRREEEARAKLDHSERRYRQLFDNMDGAFFLGEIISDASGRPVNYRILAINAAFESLSGVAAAMLIDKQDTAAVMPEEWSCFERYCKVAQDQAPEGFYHFSPRLEKYFGTRIFSPEPGQFAVLSNDITARMTAEIKVWESRKRFEDLVNSTEGVVWELDLDSLCFTFVSQHAVALLGYSPEEWFRPHFWAEHLHPDDRSRTMHYRLEQTKAGKNHACEYRLLAADGRIVWVRDLASVHVMEGISTHLSGVMIDVTESRRATQKMEEYRLAVEASHEMICVVDRDRRYVLANQAFQTMRVDGAIVVGRHIREVLGESSFSFVEPYLASCFAGEKVSFEMRQDYALGKHRDLAVTYAPIHEKEGVTRVVAVIRDVTAAKETERALIAATNAATAANLAKTEFLANMSHELRTPLNGVLGMLQLLRTTELTQEQREFIDTATSSGWSLLELLSDLLDLTRIEAGKLLLRQNPFELKQTVRHVTDSFTAPVTEKRLTFSCHLDEHLPSVLLGDEARLRQILFNVLGNAVKFTPEGGRIELQIHRGRPSDAQTIPVSFTLVDSGIGMAPGVLTTIFDPFVQGDNVYQKRYQGAGLGLAIVKRLVDLMGGTIQIESQPGTGTTLLINLPLQPVTRTQVCATIQSTPADITSVTPRHILLVEDNAINRLALQRMLEGNGLYRVSTAVNGHEALQQLAAADFDLVLMDIQMPVMDGIEALGHIRSGTHGIRNPRVPVIALTAYAMENDRDKFLRAGMTAYLSKPVDWQTMNQCLIEVLDQA